MSSMIDRIDAPEQLKGLSAKERSHLAEEIRQVLLETVSTTGGHLAASLGVVELTIALHTVFNSPKDKLIWDVGHQAYAHKLLTGRRAQFSTLRQFDGIAGFPRREESEHDAFNTGHGSTSISAALGMAEARDLRGSDEHVVAIIGDGSMTGGLAFEGLNHGGHLKTNLIVVLNDNQMSISRNTGALASYLTRVRSDPHYLRAKHAFEALAQRIPLGHAMLETTERFKDSFKHFLVPGMLFEEMGYTYLGPVDGHDIHELVESLKDAIKIGGPVVVHAITVKGKGYKLAEEDAARFHGIAPFDIFSGELLNNGGHPSYTRVFGDTLVRLADAIPNLVAITAAMPDGTGLTPFARKYPHRFFDVGMAEEHAVTFAAGLAVGGCRPVVAIYSTFLQRAYDTILHDVCLQNLPVVFALDRAGIVGEDGPTHQGMYDLSYLRHMPNMTLMAPKDENELRSMLKTALQMNGPVAFRYPRGSGVGVPLPDEIPLLPVGKSELLREGTDAAILAVGNTVHPSLEAAEALEREGIHVGVVNARFVKPLDRDAIVGLASSVQNLFTIEENEIQGGFGGAVLELLAQEKISTVKVTCLGIPDEVLCQAAPELLRQQYELDAQGIATRLRRQLRASKE